MKLTIFVHQNQNKRTKFPHVIKKQSTKNYYNNINLVTDQNYEKKNKYSKEIS